MTFLPLLPDLLLLAATLGLAAYCFVQSRRPSTPEPSDEGLRSQLADILDRLGKVESRPQPHASPPPPDPAQTGELARLLAEADDRIGRLELLLAGLEDIEARMDPDDPMGEQRLPATPVFRSNAAVGGAWT